MLFYLLPGPRLLQSKFSAFNFPAVLYVYELIGSCLSDHLDM